MRRRIDNVSDERVGLSRGKRNIILRPRDTAAIIVVFWLSVLERQLFRLAPLSLSFGFFATKRSHSTMLIAVSYWAGFGPVTRVKVKCASLKAGAPFRIDHRAVAGKRVAYAAMKAGVIAGWFRE